MRARTSLALFAARSLLGMSLVAAGAAKSWSDPPPHPGLYVLAAEIGAPDDCVELAWLLLPCLEIGLGLPLLLGYQGRLLLGTTACLLCAFAAWVVYLRSVPALAAYGCGCFGTATLTERGAWVLALARIGVLMTACALVWLLSRTPSPRPRLGAPIPSRAGR